MPRRLLNQLVELLLPGGEIRDVVVAADGARLLPGDDTGQPAGALDRGFLEAHFQLGLLLLRNGKRAAGLKNLKSALRLAEAADPGREVQSAPGTTYGSLVKILAKEIQLHTDE